MSVRVLPAVVAGLVAVVLAVLLFVPFVAREHRRRGELRPGALLLFLAGLLYALALVAYVLVPLPPLAPGFCAAVGDLSPQWRPFAGFDGLRRPQSWVGLTGLLADGSVQQFGFNVLLFVPLGMFGRHLARLSAPWTVLAGFTASLLVEVTQVTGIWFLYPCPYRLFDVDDLIANTAGALLGAVAAPLLRLVPGQRSAGAAAEPRPVTAPRRLLGMACDLLVLLWLGLIAGHGTGLALGTAGITAEPPLRDLAESAALWVLPALVLLLISARGPSPGQRAVLLRPVTPEGARPGARAVLVRWLAGIGGLALGEAVVNLLVPQAGTALALAWCAVHAAGAVRSRGHRGITGRAAGTELTDPRTAAAVRS